METPKPTRVKFSWFGKNSEDLTREELLDVIESLARQNRILAEDNTRLKTAMTSTQSKLRQATLSNFGELGPL